MIEDNKRTVSDNEKKQQKAQKRIFGVVVFIGVAALIFGIVKFYDNLSSPFALPEIDSNTETTDQQLAILEDLKTKDTDSDGLPDYDELYIYETSPYLADSDSDKIDDKTEIEQNTNPNCPEGKDCTGFGSIDINTNTTASTQVLNPEDVPIDVLRSALIDAGAPIETISSIDDETLRQMYQEALEEEGGTLSAENLNVSGSGNITLESMKNLSPQEIREFLIQSGADQSLLDQVDDQTLEAIFQDALKQQGL